ncbi:MAG: YiaA/YiaB family inner membrane protein [Alphaproteobacteria bacterium]
MSTQTQTAGSGHSAAWITFTYASFFASVAMVGFGILFAPIDIWIKAYFAMGAALLIQSCITMTKTLRDVHESGKLVNRIEDARAERLLMGIERTAA